MFMQYLNFLNQNLAATTIDNTVAVADETDHNLQTEVDGDNAIDTSFDRIQFPFANMERNWNFEEEFRNAVANLVSPPPLHDPASAGVDRLPFDGETFTCEAPAMLICASAE
jgi:hypothetical protein